jgi:hypothetical protein
MKGSERKQKKKKFQTYQSKYTTAQARFRTIPAIPVAGWVGERFFVYFDDALEKMKGSIACVAWVGSTVRKVMISRNKKSMKVQHEIPLYSFLCHGYLLVNR